MTKKKIAFICFAIVIISALFFYYNSDSIISYFENKEWENADTVGSTAIGNYIDFEGTLSNLIVIGSNYIKGYSKEAKEEFDMFVSFQEAVSSSAGDYCIIAEKNGTTAYMVSGNQKIWENTITGNIYDVYVNKNGYSVIVYKQSGYKSLAKVVTPAGEELFTSYFASTYAIDVAITNDNKTLAIAEIDTEGIHVESYIKIIDINNVNSNNVKKYDLGENELVSNIEYTDKNELLVMTDKKVMIINADGIKEVLSYSYEKTISATIENKKNIITVEKEEAGLFDIKYTLGIYSYNDELEKKEYELYDLPEQIVVQNNLVAVVMHNELLIVNTNGKLVKRCNISRNVKTVVLYNNANMVGLIFRDKIEFLKL